VITKLHELPEAHSARNTAIQDLDVMIVCRHTGTKRDPRAWKIKNDTFNRLGDTWRNNFDWVLK
jgi:hypothetical protein